MFDDKPFIALKPVQGSSPAECQSWVAYNAERRYPFYTQEFDILPECEAFEAVAALSIGFCTPVTVVGQSDGYSIVDYGSLGKRISGFTTEFVLKDHHGKIATKGIIKADNWREGGPLDAEQLEPNKIYYLGEKNGGLTLEPNDFPMFKALSFTEAELLI
jgi:hypothetical protein